MDQQNEPKIIRINILQTSMTLGTYLGAYIILAYLVTLLTVKYPALSLLAVPLFIGIPVVAFFLIRRFRDSTQAPFFPFPISWMISILTFLFATALSCMVAYLYLRFIDNGALASGLMARMEEMMAQSGAVTSAFTDPAQVEQYNQTMELFRQTITWFCSLPASGVTKQLIQTSLVWGNILSLFIGLLTAKRIRLK
jgi:membrane protein implicated in regulation of membrane protease activity